MRSLRLAALAVCIFAALPAHARITEINVQKVEPFANGATFGNAGAYERVWGVAKGWSPQTGRDSPAFRA